MYVFAKSHGSGTAPPTPGKLNLKIAGFSRQSIVSISQIVQAIDLLPAFHLEGLREIVYAPDWNPTLTPDPCSPRPPGQVKGEFRQRERRIIFFDFDSADLFYQVLYHEIGHFVFFLALNSKVKKHWVTEIYPRSACITPYGTVNASEDFAETYACYVRDPEALKQLPEKYAFMRDCIFSGDPATLKERN
jgi:hypothetical protein